ncbi:MexW/MexI family multidrug efflux RND transporter permease subunit [Benzoatithermus flavus]|uniref:MexW/MexI family multidrug efflux RND transporter permease subunit n=1 Tax=Benzoatithermus flavus TaxID=3108223 RepID=A0ABU8XTA6_9PROT
MRFTDIFVRRPVLATVVSLLILLIGLRAFFTLPIRQYPEVKNTVITVTTSYPGASAELMQGFITVPIAQAVAGAEGVEYLTSNSVQGTSTVQAHIRLNQDPNKAMTDVMAKVNQVKYLIPREANDPIISKTTGGSLAVMYMGFGSHEMAGPAITDYLTRVVQPLLATVPGVASAEILGGQPFAMRVWLDPTRMAARGVSAQDVAAALAANNYQSAAGQTKGYFTVSNISAATGLQSIDEFRAMVVKAANGALVRLGDIATVELGAKSSDSSVMMNGQHAVFIGINATPDGNPLEIVKGIRALVPTLERGLPPTLTMEIPYDSTEFINASIHEVERTLGEAILIVIVVIFLFLGSVRSVLIPVVTIPLSIIGAGTLMLAMGFSLNLLTLLAMVLAIGLVVDDAIVVVENVYRHIEEGRTPLQAALIGAREIAGPVISMTITLAAVYAPIGFLSGLTGSLFREFAFTLAGSVIISGIVALTLSPMMCSLLLSAESQHGRFARLVDRTFGAVTRWYGRRLHNTLEYRPATALFALGVLASLPFLFLNTSAELAPEEDQGVLFAVTKGPQNANIDYMNVFGEAIDKVFQSFPETSFRFIVAGMDGGANNGFAGMALKPWDQRQRSAKELQPLVQGALQEKVTGVQAFVFSLPPLPDNSQGMPVQMVISSPSGFETIYKVMEELKAAARKSGLFMVSDSDLAFNSPTVRIEIDRTKANDLGITMQEIGSSLATLLGGNYVNRFSLEGRSYEVIPQVPRSLRLAPERLGQYYVKTRSGESIPLSTVVRITTGTEPNALTQYNQLNAATFSAVPMPGVTMGQAVDFLRQEAERLLPADFRYDFLSQSRQYVQEGNQLTITFAFALVIIFLVLAAQFESLRDPLVILVSVPMSICGALLPLFFGVATLNIYTQIGLVTLIGLISKHGILMVEFANELQRNEGLDRRAAIEEAAKVRLRPILMTTAAMVVGLVPLLYASGAGAASRFSIGLVIVAGMSIGTLFTLFVLPTVYTYLASDHRPARRARREAEIREVLVPAE